MGGIGRQTVRCASDRRSIWKPTPSTFQARRQRHPATRELRFRTRGERLRPDTPIIAALYRGRSSTLATPALFFVPGRESPRGRSRREISPKTSHLLNAADPVSSPAGHPRFGSIDMGAGGNLNDTIDANGDGHVNITKGARRETPVHPVRPPPVVKMKPYVSIVSRRSRALTARTRSGNFAGLNVHVSSNTPSKPLRASTSLTPNLPPQLPVKRAGLVRV